MKSLLAFLSLHWHEFATGVVTTVAYDRALDTPPMTWGVAEDLFLTFAAASGLVGAVKYARTTTPGSAPDAAGSGDVVGANYVAPPMAVDQQPLAKKAPVKKAARTNATASNGLGSQ